MKTKTIYNNDDFQVIISMKDYEKIVNKILKIDSNNRIYFSDNQNFKLRLFSTFKESDFNNIDNSWIDNIDKYWIKKYFNNKIKEVTKEILIKIKFPLNKKYYITNENLIKLNKKLEKSINKYEENNNIDILDIVYEKFEMKKKEIQLD